MILSRCCKSIYKTQGPSSQYRIKLQISEHSAKQYFRLRNPSLKTTKGLLIVKGPSPGESSPTLMQVARHLVVHDSAFLDFGHWIRGFVQSLANEHSPESVRVCWAVFLSLGVPPEAQLRGLKLQQAQGSYLQGCIYACPVRLLLLWLEMLLLPPLLFRLTECNEDLTQKA